MKRPLQHQTHAKFILFEIKDHHPNLKKIAMRRGCFSKFPEKWPLWPLGSIYKKTFEWNIEVIWVPTDTQ